MKNFLMTILLAITGILCFMAFRIPVFAAENNELNYNYYIECTYDGTRGKGYVRREFSSEDELILIVNYDDIGFAYGHASSENITGPSYCIALVSPDAGILSTDPYYISIYDYSKNIRYRIIYPDGVISASNSGINIPYKAFSLDDGFKFGAGLSFMDGLKTNMKIFSSPEAAYEYASTGNDAGQINKEDFDSLVEEKPVFDDFVDINFQDTNTHFLSDFRLEGFYADFFVNATWTSVHIPKKLQQYMDKGGLEMDDIGIMVMFTYTNKDFGSADKKVRYYPTLLSASSLKATIEVSKFVAPDNYYLSDLAFIPVVEFTYYNSGMGAVSNPIKAMYYGSMSHIYFKSDGSPNGSDFDSGDINGNKDGGWSLGDDNYNGFHGITGDISDLTTQFTNIVKNVGTAVSSLASSVTVFFGWLPWWATAALGGIVLMCVILRLLGR